MAKKKTFISENADPTLTFISEESIKAKDQPHEDGAALKAPTGERPPKGYKYNPMYIEVKSKRVQLVFQPSLYERVKAASEREGLSFNEYCHRVLDEATKEKEE